MRLHEYEAADVFESMGIPVPRRGVAADVEGALRVAGEIGYPVILKAQVLVGGRGLAGGSPNGIEPGRAGKGGRGISWNRRSRESLFGRS
jgi:succinyl-CoA synthetase beta subunit